MRGRVVARGQDGVGQLKPSARRDGVDLRIVDGDGDDARFNRRGGDAHETPQGTKTSTCLVRYHGSKAQDKQQEHGKESRANPL
ncbi:Uncharacterised protein [Mycobacteroides abscessus subsp. massiliense]|nr:Uncharacterised protein [Mycobacteroides abscessus subsp. massiliense]